MVVVVVVVVGASVAGAVGAVPKKSVRGEGGTTAVRTVGGIVGGVVGGWVDGGVLVAVL
jgi:hypothetical protein